MGGGARSSINWLTVLWIGVCSYLTSMVLVDLTKAILTEPRQSKAGRASRHPSAVIDPHIPGHNVPK